MPSPVGRRWDAEPIFDIPTMPLDPTALDDRELMTLFSKYVQWENFISMKVGEYEFDEMGAENQYRLIFARTVAASMEKPMAAKNEACLNENVQDAQDTLNQAKAFRKVYGLQRDALSRLSSLVSRELTRRSSHPAERRLERMTP